MLSHGQALLFGCVPLAGLASHVPCPCAPMS